MSDIALTVNGTKRTVKVDDGRDLLAAETGLKAHILCRAASVQLADRTRLIAGGFSRRGGGRGG